MAENPVYVLEKSQSPLCRMLGRESVLRPRTVGFPGTPVLLSPRAVGEGIAVAATCPGWNVSEHSLDTLSRMADFVDYGLHRTCAPIALVEAYWLVQRLMD